MHRCGGRQDCCSWDAARRLIPIWAGPAVLKHRAGQIARPNADNTPEEASPSASVKGDHLGGLTALFEAATCRMSEWPQAVVGSVHRSYRFGTVDRLGCDTDRKA